MEIGSIVQYKENNRNIKKELLYVICEEILIGGQNILFKHIFYNRII